MMRCRYLLFAFTLLTLICGCKNNEAKIEIDNLEKIKKKFLNSIFQGELNEGPFNLQYSLETVFFSKQVISLFGVCSEYTNLPHGRARYEGKTFYAINNQFQEIKLSDLFTTQNHIKQLISYCENNLKNRPISYFAEENALHTTLSQDDLYTFVIDDQFLILVFQPYAVGNYVDGPFFVKIPYEHAKNMWDTNNPLALLIDDVVSSGQFISSWNEG
jgi:hypothetical protein